MSSKKTEPSDHFKHQPFIISVDESEKDEVFVFSHLHMNQRQASILSRKWGVLQRRIQSSLIARNNKKSQDPRIQGDNLPEIHAEWLCQSSEYYRWKDAPNKFYWKEHFYWLEEALKIIRHVKPQLFFATQLYHKDRSEKTIKIMQEEISAYKNQLSASEIKDFEEVLELFRSPYAPTFAGVVLEVDGYMQYLNRKAKLICDNYDNCKGFSNLEIYEIIKEHNFMTNITPPDFLSSEDEIFLQAADICAYVYCQIQWQTNRENQNIAFEENYKTKKLRYLAERYLLPLDKSEIISLLPFNHKIIDLRRIMFLELAQKRLSIHSTVRKNIQANSDNQLAKLFNP